MVAGKVLLLLLFGTVGFVAAFQPGSFPSSSSHYARLGRNKFLLTKKADLGTPLMRPTSAMVPPKMVLGDMTSLTTAAAFGPNEINTAFNIATFLPQPFWLLMILLPNAGITKKIMGNPASVLFFALNHLFIVFVAASQTDGTAPIAEFADVFDPAGDPFGAMQGMMKYPNFVAEEWPHVLTWDLFVGQMIWADGLRRGIFTPHSVLLTNLIGPPGLLLHTLTCLVTGKGLPSLGLPEEGAAAAAAEGEGEGAAAAAEGKPAGPPRAERLARELFGGLYAPGGAAALAAACAEDVVWEDTLLGGGPLQGRAAVVAALAERVAAAGGEGAGVRLVVERAADGAASSGLAWHLEVDSVPGKWGLQGTTFFALNDKGQIRYARECVEPLFKPGGAIAGLLAAVSEDAVKKGLVPAKAAGLAERAPRGAADTVRYMWLEAYGKEEFGLDKLMAMFSEGIYYRDFNYDAPFVGKAEVANFVEEFDFPGIKFVAEEISEGERGCCFTWRVEIAGQEQAIRGVSYYELDDAGKVKYVRDIPEPALKPAPLQALATSVRPGLRTLWPVDPVVTV